MRLKAICFPILTKLQISSKDIKEGDIFIALQGSNTHGNEFISNALSNGAKYIVTDNKYERKIIIIKY